MKDDLLRRGMAAYFRTGGTDQPSEAISDVREHDGKRYVVLGNANGVLAVYRVTNQGQLRRLKRYPEELNAA